MNILDEDIGLSQRQQLEAWKIHFRQIGVEIGRSGMKDHEGIMPLLHRLKRPTFFTLDTASISPRCGIRDTAWSFLMSGRMRPPHTFAASYATLSFARNHSAWAKSFASTTAE